MSSDIYRVDIVKVTAKAVTFRLVILNAESGNMPEGKPWALMVAGEAFHDGHVENSIGTHLSSSDRADEKFLIANAERHIASIVLDKTKNFPIEDERRYDEEDHSTKPTKVAWGEYTLTFTDPTWTKGWKVGKRWGSTSYAPFNPAPAPPRAKPIADKRTSLYFVEPKLSPARIEALLKQITARRATEIDSNLSYLVYPDGLSMKHEAIQTAWRVGASSALSLMTESELVEYADERWEPDGTRKRAPRKATTPKKAAPKATKKKAKTKKR